MDVFITLFFIFYIIFGAVCPPPVLAISQSGSVTISAIVPEAKTTTTITATRGGSAVLTNTDDTAVVISAPANVYTEDLTLEANSYPSNFFSSTKPAPSGENFIGKTYDFSLVVASGAQQGTQVSVVSAPVSITLNYIDSDFVGQDESTITPYRWGEGDSSWQPISGATVDTVNNKVTFSTTHFSSFALFASPLPQQPPQQQGGGGGGGGGGGIIFPLAPTTSTVILSGRAYPQSTVTILKDAQVAATTTADSNANFQVNIGGLSAGNYTFSVYSEDSRGHTSPLLTFPVGVTSGATVTEGDIFLAPTIAVDKSTVKQGDTLAIFGQAAPSANITVLTNSAQELFATTTSDASGAYLYNLDTTPLETGQHTSQSKAALNSSISPLSKAVTFDVGTQNIEKPTQGMQGDIDGDGRVNLVDFSILAYWYGRPNPPANVDFDNDADVDLVDFSILAYYWTG